jgi:hypothetical protein
VTIYSTVGTLLATIPGMTLGTNLFTPENPQVDFSLILPYLRVKRISSHGEARLDGTNMYNSDRIQVTLAAATQTGLEVLIGQVNAILNYNRSAFIGAWPLGYGPDGHDVGVTDTFWITADWLILY